MVKSKQEALMKRLEKMASDFDWKHQEAIKTRTKGRGKGGILVGVRKGLGDSINISTWPNGAVITGLKLWDGGKKCRIIAAYNNIGIDKILKQIRDKMDEGREQGEAIIVMGDLNARVGELQAGEGEDIYQRKSRDKKVLREGRKLAEFCDIEGLVIANGAVRGDWEGAITCVGNRDDVEGSVIDLVLHEGDRYVLGELRIWPTIDSDHLGVGITLLGEGGAGKGAKPTSRRESGRGEREAEGEKLVWKPEAIEEYQKSLERMEIAAGGEEDLESRWKRIKTAIWEAAEDTGLTKRLGKKRPKDDSDWLGDEFKLQRAVVFKHLKRFVKGGGGRG